jgi:hypothetical protein
MPDVLEGTLLLALVPPRDIASLDALQFLVPGSGGRFLTAAGEAGRVAVVLFDRPGGAGASDARAFAEEILPALAHRAGAPPTILLLTGEVCLDGDTLEMGSAALVEGLARLLEAGRLPAGRILLVGGRTCEEVGGRVEPLAPVATKGREASLELFLLAEDPRARMAEISLGMTDTEDVLPDLPSLPPVPPWLGREAITGDQGALPDAATADRVQCTVFAPARVAPGDSLLVQAFAHLPHAADEAARFAREFDDVAVRRVCRFLEKLVARGSRLTFELAVSGAVVHDPVAHLGWQGRTDLVQFAVDVPADRAAGTLFGRLTVSQDSVPVGQLLFKLTVQAGAAGVHLPVGEAARRFTRAFVSYASADRTRVLARVQMLAPLGIRYFQDVLDLEPGSRWDRELYRRIDECDLFLLFWSRAARESEWVLREVRYALARQGAEGLDPPTIIPIALDLPADAPPPPELAHLHFADRVAYLAGGTGA